MVVKKVLKKPIKKAVKKPIRKAVKKPIRKNAFNKGGPRGNPANLRRGADAGAIASYGLGSLKDYGGDNGAVLFSPTTLAVVVAWGLIILRYVLFYGAFE